MATLIQCSACKKRIASDAQNCPKCGHVITDEEREKAVAAAKSAKSGCLTLFIILVIIGFIGDYFISGGSIDFTGKTSDQMTKEIKKLDSRLQRVELQTAQNGAQIIVAAYLADATPSALLMESPRIKEILKSIATGKGNPFGGVMLVLNEPSVDQLGNKGQEHAVTLGWDIAELQKANWDNLTDWQALDLSTVMAVGPFGKDTIAKYCKEGANSYAKVFCSKVGYGRQ